MFPNTSWAVWSVINKCVITSTYYIQHESEEVLTIIINIAMARCHYETYIVPYYWHTYGSMVGSSA